MEGPTRSQLNRAVSTIAPLDLDFLLMDRVGIKN